MNILHILTMNLKSPSFTALRLDLGLMAGLLLASTPAAHAAVFYSGLQDIAIPTGLDGVYLDLDTGSTSASSLTGWDINLFYGGYAIANIPTFQPGRLTSAVDSVVLNLAAGTSAGPSAFSVATTFAGSEGHVGNGAGQFASGTEGYLGFLFTPDGGSDPYYGWMRVVLTPNTAGGLIRDWAYQTDGTPMTVGEVPEPEHAAVVVGVLLAMFAVAKQEKVRRKASSA